MTAKLDLKLTVTALEEALATGLHLSAEPDVTHVPSGHTATLTPSSSPAVTKLWSESRALVAGADMIDLQALPRGNLPNETFAGLKVQVVVIHVLATASANMTFDPTTTTNPYLLFGAAGKLVLGPDDWAFLIFNETTPDVSGTTKEIDVAGTGTEGYEILLAAG